MSEVEGTLAANIWDRVIGADEHGCRPMKPVRYFVGGSLSPTSNAWMDFPLKHAKANFRQSSSMNWMSTSPSNRRLLV